MVDNFNRQILRVAVAQICQSMGWDALQKSTHDTLTDVMQRYLEEIGKVAYSYTQLCKSLKSTVVLLQYAIQFRWHRCLFQLRYHILKFCTVVQTF